MSGVYSFADISCSIKHPNVGTFDFVGTGVGSITIAYANDITAHDTAADGEVMISKIDVKSGTIAIAVQQTSDANKWLTKWYNYIRTAKAEQFDKATINMRVPSMNEGYQCSRVSPQKFPDRPYQQTGQQVTWTLMAAKIEPLTL